MPNINKFKIFVHSSSVSSFPVFAKFSKCLHYLLKWTVEFVVNYKWGIVMLYYIPKLYIGSVTALCERARDRSAQGPGFLLGGPGYNINYFVWGTVYFFC